MLFAFICTDKPNSVDLRMKVRPDHLKHLEELGPKLKLAGPFTNDEGSPIGSLVVVDAESRAAAEKIAAADPYTKEGLFASVEVRAWKWTFGNPETK
ncbi:YciI family protein [Aestuariivirga sp.]|uniref:YciI family protein n=1 Tax=Aestuariivirga sp. TaxID=2650926 RepID=UPI0039E36AB7